MNFHCNPEIEMSNIFIVFEWQKNKKNNNGVDRCRWFYLLVAAQYDDNNLKDCEVFALCKGFASINNEDFFSLWSSLYTEKERLVGLFRVESS